VPSHAIPPGRDGRAQRRSVRRRRLLDGWQRLPMGVLLLTSLQVAGLAEPIHGSAVSQVLHVIRVGLLGAVVMVLVVAIGALLPARVRTWARDAAAPRPRWLYLLAAIGCLAIAVCVALLSLRAGSGLAARLCYAACVWSGLYGLVLIGRAASWGRIRALLWWALFTRDKARPAKTPGAQRSAGPRAGSRAHPS
jgi:hypothetical protein